VTVRGRTAATILAAVALSVTGCTGTETKAAARAASAQTAAQVVAAANSKTLAAKSAKVALQVTTTAKGQAPVELTGTGAYDTVSGDTSMRIIVPTVGEIEVRTVDRTVYAKLPAELAGSLGGKPWVKLDAKALAAAGMGQLSQLNPAEQLGYLHGVTGDAEVVGEEAVDGTPTTHYRVTIDLDRAAKSAPAPSRASIAEARKALGAATLPADVWIDAEGRVRKFATTMEMTPTSVAGAAGATGPMTVDLTVAYSDFGTAVDVTAPPAAEMTDLSALTGGR
jgi:hypothetical protein